MKDRCKVILSIHPAIQPAIWYYWMVITPLSKHEEYKDTLDMVPTLKDNIIQWKNHISKLYAIKNKLLLKYRGRHLTQVQGIGPSRLSGGRVFELRLKEQVGVIWVHIHKWGSRVVWRQEAAWNSHLLLRVCRMWSSASESLSMCLEVRQELDQEGLCGLSDSLYCILNALRSHPGV